jgi:multiple sugar transport system permease protein
MAAKEQVTNRPKIRTWWALNDKLTPYKYLSPTIILLLALMFVPLSMVISYTFMDNVIVNKNPIFVGFANYVSILTDSLFHTAVINLFFVVSISVLFHMIISLTFSMLLNTKLLPSFVKAIFRVIYILPWVFTTAIVAVVWRLILNPNGIINYMLETLGIINEKIAWLSDRGTALPIIIFANIWAGYPFFMVSILAGLQGISADLYEAATVDGANGVMKFFYVTIPQLKPIIISMVMLDCVWTTQIFSLIWMTTSGGPGRATEVLGTITYRMAFNRYEFSRASTTAVIMLIVTMCLAIFYVRNQKARD